MMEQALRVILSHKAFNLFHELESDPIYMARVHKENVLVTGFTLLEAIRKRFKKGKNINKMSNDLMEFCVYWYARIKHGNNARLLQREIKHTRNRLSNSTGELAALSVEAHNNRKAFDTHQDGYIKGVILETFNLK